MGRLFLFAWLAALCGLAEPVESNAVPSCRVSSSTRPRWPQHGNTDWLRAVSAGQFVEWAVPDPFLPTGSCHSG